jgi:hypothetical protein
MVALRCLRVWKCICSSRGLPSCRANRFLVNSNEVLLLVNVELPNSFGLFLGNAINIRRHFSVTLRVLGVPLFLGRILMVRLT